MAKDPSNHHTQIELVVIEPSPISTQPSHAGVSKSTILPILARFHAGYFRISLSLCSQALLWKTLGEPMPEAHSLRPLLRRLPAKAFVLLWVVALLTLISLSLLYTMKCLLQFNKVKDEFSNRIGVNYLFAPWISWLLLLQSSPFFNPNTALYLVLWWVFIVPILVMDVKIYGQWFTKGKRFLSGVANPTSQLSVIGNLVAALAAARMGWKEAAVGLFALGMAHYLVLFVTLYQRLAGSDCLLPAILRPVLFLFFAAPSVASLAWDSIAGSFDNPSKMLFFLSLFLFLSLVSRPALFRKSMKKFDVAWWAYSFPLTVLAIASSEYAMEVNSAAAHVLMLLLSALSVLVSLVLLLFTAFNTNLLLLPPKDPFQAINPPAAAASVATANCSAV